MRHGQKIQLSRRFRDGAGRKPQYNEPTRRPKVPESQADSIVAYLAAYRDRRTLEDDGVRMHEPRPIVAGRRRTTVLVVGYRPEAGLGSHAEDFVEEQVDVNAHLIRKGHEGDTFIVRASGWSMIGAGMHDGDEVIVDRSLPDEQFGGRAAVDGDLVIKQLLVRGGKLALVSDNPHYPQRTLKRASGWKSGAWPRAYCICFDGADAWTDNSRSSRLHRCAMRSQNPTG